MHVSDPHRSLGGLTLNLYGAGCVWGVAFLPNNDLVTGCSDSTARVWTTDSARVAPAEALQALQERIAARAQSGTSSISFLALADCVAFKMASSCAPHPYFPVELLW